MEGTYPVTYLGEKVGTVTLCHCGLYYDLRCRCRSVGENMLQLILTENEQHIDLGLMMPNQNQLELIKRIPVKQLRITQPDFSLKRRIDDNSIFVSVESEHSFPYLHRIMDCFFDVYSGKKGVKLPKENNDEKNEIYT